MMLLVIDVGNTNITIGVYREKELIRTFRMTTKQARTSDEYGINLCGLMEHKGISPQDVEAAIISSVVPDVMHSLGSSLVKYFDIYPLVVTADLVKNITVKTDAPGQVGPDRLVDASAAIVKYGGPLIVVDFGTATTYDLVSGEGEFLAGVTSPGIRLSARALWKEAAMLPEIEIRMPKSILAKETISSMQAGLVYGYIGQTEYIIKKMKEESGFLDAKVISTGGLGSIFLEGTNCIDVYEPMLTLEGLRIIYEMQKG